MTIYRQHRYHRYTNVPNPLLEDSALSFRARGLHAYLLSKPDGWEARISELTRATTEGRDAVRAARRELVGAGYLVEQVERDDGGRVRTVTHVFDAPGHTTADVVSRVSDADLNANPQVTPDAGKPRSGKPDSGFSVGKQVLEPVTTDGTKDQLRRHGCRHDDAGDEDHDNPTNQVDQHHHDAPSVAHAPSDAVVVRTQVQTRETAHNGSHARGNANQGGPHAAAVDRRTPDVVAVAERFTRAAAAAHHRDADDHERARIVGVVADAIADVIDHQHDDDDPLADYGHPGEQPRSRADRLAALAELLDHSDWRTPGNARDVAAVLAWRVRHADDLFWWGDGSPGSGPMP